MYALVRTCGYQVKDKLIFEQKKMAAVDQRKREKEQRQYAKQVQAERTKEKNLAKKASQAALKSLTKRKNRYRRRHTHTPITKAVIPHMPLACVLCVWWRLQPRHDAGGRRG